MRRALTFAALRTLPCGPLFAAPVAITPVSVPRAAVAVAMRFGGFSLLADVSRRELEEEKQRDGKPEKPEIPKGWELKKVPGMRGFSMHRQHEDEEVIIRCHGESKDEEENDVEVECTVLITRNKETMIFDVATENDEIVVNSVRFYDEALAKNDTVEGEKQRNAAYGGPHLDELEVDFVDGVINFLESRGVSDEMSKFVHRYNYWAEQAEYETWLQSVNRFVS